ncbi:MAG: hypothetical protein F9B45_13535 [Phycisphaera sp. RhM]|nr:hypothetical protein [Phycisphaera sp. RhM]
MLSLFHLTGMLVWMGWIAAAATTAQSPGNSLDVPQTRLAPITAPITAPSGPVASPPATSGQVYSGQVYSGQGYGSPYNTAPSNSPAGGSQFDPYAGAPASGFVRPSPSSPVFGSPSGLGGGLFGAPTTVAPQGGFFAPASPQPTYGTPIYGGLANQPPPMIDAGSLFGGNASAGLPLNPSSNYAAPPSYGYPSTAYPSGSPSTLFPGGLLGNTPSFSPQLNPYRLIQRMRFRHTYLQDGNGSDDLGINDTDVALAFAIPSFLYTTQPLFIAPSFSLHLWDGPQSITGADLPGSAYSAFLDFAWQSDPNRILGVDLGLSVGMFSEFQTFDIDALRVRGKGLGTFRITPASTLKVGVYYYDRVDVKLLPAVGLFWRPNAFTKVDLFFPQPRYSRYLSTVGTNDVWWYVAGEYGGGSWTIERDGKGEDQVDINDIRLTTGFEWGESQRMRAGLRTWFFEFGYVGDRELVYRRNPADNLSISDTWMFRLGLGY